VTRNDGVPGRVCIESSDLNIMSTRIVSILYEFPINQNRAQDFVHLISDPVVKSLFASLFKKSSGKCMMALTFRASLKSQQKQSKVDTE
jgi:hypothetical protein